MRIVCHKCHKLNAMLVLCARRQLGFKTKKHFNSLYAQLDYANAVTSAQVMAEENKQLRQWTLLLFAACERNACSAQSPSSRRQLDNANSTTRIS